MAAIYINVVSVIICQCCQYAYCYSFQMRQRNLRQNTFSTVRLCSIYYNGLYQTRSQSRQSLFLAAVDSSKTESPLSIVLIQYSKSRIYDTYHRTFNRSSLKMGVMMGDQTSPTKFCSVVDLACCRCIGKFFLLNQQRTWEYTSKQVSSCRSAYSAWYDKQVL